jgi:hypothetical protein
LSQLLRPITAHMELTSQMEPPEGLLMAEP